MQWLTLKLERCPHAKKREKESLEKAANKRVKEAQQAAEGSRGGWWDLLARQDEEKHFQVENLYSLVVLSCRQVDDVPPWAN